MKLVFTAEYAGLWLLLTGLIILTFVYSRIKKKKRVMKFGNYETLEKVSEGQLIRSDILVMALRVLAVTVLLVGLSSPALVYKTTGAESDIVLAIDKSASMQTADVEPTRFDAAKQVSKDFTRELGNATKVGVVSYAGEVQEESSLTHEKEEVRSTIDQISIGEEAGTATGDAVITSSSMLTPSERNRMVVVVTDGRQNVGTSVNESIEFANRHNVTVNPVGIGPEQPGTGSDDGFMEEEDALEADFPNLNVTNLNTLANRTGGEAVFVHDREGLETAFVELTEKEHEENIQTYFFMLAGILLVIDAVIRTTDYQIIP